MKAMILAAGQGQRMQPLTETTPKPLLPVCGKLLIDYHLEALAATGIKEVVINVCYHANKIINYLGEGQRYGINIKISHENNGCLGTGGGIKHALNLLGPQPFILLSADIFTYFPLHTLLREELLSKFSATNGNKHHRLAHLVLVNNPDYNPKGDFILDTKKNLLQLEGAKANKLTYAGIGIIHPQLFANSPQEAFSLSVLLKKGIMAQAITGEHYRGFWDNIGTPQQLESLNRTLTISTANSFPSHGIKL